ncbi:protein of unknown function [Xenorhabdus poinarii G6]|uniref:Uncharacterized protein n=1 Tax=Xenorhabdus poinarii G6 TaxID=1354304 RepID=A0A068QYR1_9GAMM|nr:protein of unknown function [Xenorhabdus poinarii G6]
MQRRLKGVITRSELNKPAVALTNKNARIVWLRVNQQSSYEARWITLYVAKVKAHNLM